MSNSSNLPSQLFNLDLAASSKCDQKSIRLRSDHTHIHQNSQSKPGHPDRSTKTTSSKSSSKSKSKHKEASKGMYLFSKYPKNSVFMIYNRYHSPANPGGRFNNSRLYAGMNKPFEELSKTEKRRKIKLEEDEGKQELIYYGFEHEVDNESMRKTIQ